MPVMPAKAGIQRLKSLDPAKTCRDDDYVRQQWPQADLTAIGWPEGRNTGTCEITAEHMDVFCNPVTQSHDSSRSMSTIATIA
jgi:hypothetical protein